MELFDSLFGKRKRKVKDERFQEFLRKTRKVSIPDAELSDNPDSTKYVLQAVELAMASEVKKFSNRGHPICPNCGAEVPVPDDELKKMHSSFARGSKLIACPKCGQKMCWV